jgi:hypothetical protein
MAVAHYGYLVLKIPSPNGILKIRGDRDMGVYALEKLQALAAAHEAAEKPGGRTSYHQARTSAAQPQHPTCNPKTSP